MVDHNAGRCPAQPAARELRSFRRCSVRVLSPTASILPAPIPAHPNLQRGAPMSERSVREATRECSARSRFITATVAPGIRHAQPAFDHRPVGLEALPDRSQAELIEAAKRCQVRGRAGGVEHVEVFRQELA